MMRHNNPAIKSLMHPKTYLSLILGDIELSLKQRSTPIKSVPLLFVSSKAHASWTRDIAKHLTQELQVALPDTDISVEIKMLNADSAESASALKKTCKNYSTAERVNGEFSYIITPGWLESVAVRDMRVSLGVETKQLFCIAGDPEQLGFAVASRNCAGVYTPAVTAKAHLQAIKTFRPHVRRLCVMYDERSSSERLHEYKKNLLNDFKAVCRAEGTQLLVHSWNPDDMNEGALHETLAKSTAVVLLQEEAAYAHRESIAELCDQYGVLLSASDLDSVVHGAAIGHGSTAANYATPLCSIIVTDIATDECKGLFAIEQPSGPRFNSAALERQGAQLSDQVKDLLAMRSIYDDVRPAYTLQRQE
jgi:hypothetical protein